MLILLFFAIWASLTGLNLERKCLVISNPVEARRYFLMSGLCSYLGLVLIIGVIRLFEGQSSLYFISMASGLVVLSVLTLLEFQKKYVQVHMHLKAGLIIFLVFFIANIVFLTK
jgi:hypothetical protein